MVEQQACSPVTGKLRYSEWLTLDSTEVTIIQEVEVRE